MATTTPNFGWAVPTSTDLVKDGAVAIETLGDSIDASLVDLKGGTTGQVLSKASNTDMDFTWVTDAAGDITGVTAGVGISGGGTSGTVTVTNSMATAITTAGDLIRGTGSGTFERFGIGSTGQVLTVTAGVPTWATPAGGGGGMTSLASASFSTGVNTVTISSISGDYNELLIHVDGWRAASDDTLRIRVNGVTSSVSFANASVSIGNQAFDGGGAEISGSQDNGAANGFIRISIPNYAKTSWKIIDSLALTNNETTNSRANMQRIMGGLNVTSAVTSVTLYTGNGSNFGAGSYTIYGVK